MGKLFVYLFPFEFKSTQKFFAITVLFRCVCMGCFFTFGLSTLSASLILQNDSGLIKHSLYATSGSDKVKALIRQSEDQMNQDLPGALLTAKEALDLLESNKDKGLLYETLNQMASVCFYLGMLEEAAKYWSDALELVNDLQDELNIAKITFNLSALYLSLKEYPKALEYLKRAKLYFDHYGQSNEFIENRIQILNNYAIISQHTGELQKAMERFEAALSLATEHNMQRNLLQVYSSFSNFLASEGHTMRARSMMEKLLQLNNRMFKDPVVELATQMRLAQLESTEGRIVEARDMMRRLDTASLAHRIPDLRKEILRNLKQYEITLDNPHQALNYQQQLDSIEKEEQYHDALRYLEKKELLQALNRQSRADKQGYMLYIKGLIVLIFCFILFFLWKLRRQSQKTRYLLEKQAQTSTQLDALRNRNLKLRQALQNETKQFVSQTIEYSHKKHTFLNYLERSEKNLQITNTHPPFSLDQFRSSIMTQNNKLWLDFDLRFNEINSDFYKKLDRDFPNLTINEKRLCAFLKLELTTKEIISLTGQSIRAVEIARTRLRNKLGLSHSSESLPQFFRKY